ncbi:MAG: radical SAM protein [Patescibacteria group bacterium]
MITLVYPEDGRLEQLVPLGLCFVGAYLERYGIRVNALDMRHHKIDDLKRAAKTSEFLGFSVMTIRLNKALKFAQIAKKANPKVKIIFGGPHPSIYPKETLTNKQVDFVVIGEGEETALDLVRHSDKPEAVNGIAYKKGRQTIITKPRDRIEDLDSLPFPDRDLFPLKEMLKKAPYWPCITPYPQLSMLSIRGCPYNCNYCQPTLRKIFTNTVKRRSPERTVDEMEFLYRKYQPASIFMADDLFTANKEWALAVCREIRKRGLHKKLIWECESRVNTVDDQIARELKKSGCYMLWFGIESYSQKTLNTLRKGTTAEQNIKAIKLCQKHGLMVLEQMMVGNPNESLKDLYQTLRTSRQVKADISAVSVTSPIPGTDLYDSLVKENKLLIKNSDELGARYRGREKFELQYSADQRDRVYDRLKFAGEINLWYLLTRDYYRAVFLRRMKSHLETGNFGVIFTDLARIVYGALPFPLANSLERLVAPIKGFILQTS